MKIDIIQVEIFALLCFAFRLFYQLIKIKHEIEWQLRNHETMINKLTAIINKGQK